MTPTLALGNKTVRRSGRSRGFTLIELMVVVAIVAISAGLISLAMRDPAAGQLAQEGQRLAALFDGARATARASGQPVTWWPAGSLNNSAAAPLLPQKPATENSTAQAGPPDFLFAGLPQRASLPTRWLSPAPIRITVSNAGKTVPQLILGPEPLLPPQSVTLGLDDQQLTLSSDGLGPFRVTSSGPVAP